MTRVRGSLAVVVTSLGLGLGVAACGGADDPAGAGTAAANGASGSVNGAAGAVKGATALKAKPTDPATSSDPKRLNEAESAIAGQAVDPPVCDLVSLTQARAILGASVAPPTVAPQGPTCIYRARTPKGENPRNGFVTVALEHRDFTDARRQLARARRVDVAGQAGVCGLSGQPMMFIEVSRGRVLEIVGTCGTAKRFAAQALMRLGA